MYKNVGLENIFDTVLNCKSDKKINWNRNHRQKVS